VLNERRHTATLCSDERRCMTTQIPAKDWRVYSLFQALGQWGGSKKQAGDQGGLV